MCKKFIKLIYACLLFIYAGAWCNAAVTEFKLEPVSIERIDKLAHKFCDDYSHKKRMQILIWTGIATAVLSGVGLLVWDWRKNENKEVDIDRDAKNRSNTLRYQDLKKKRGILGKFRYTLLTMLLGSACTAIVKIVCSALSITTDGAAALLFSNSLSDVKTYRERQAKIKESLIKLASIRDLKSQKDVTQDSDIQHDSASQVDMLGIMATDLIGSHRILACFLQELLAFTKFWTIMNSGKQSIQYVAVSHECLELCNDFNAITKQMTKIINSIDKTTDSEELDSQEFFVKYSIFGKKLTKFTFDYGLNFYGNDFLQ